MSLKLCRWFLILYDTFVLIHYIPYLSVFSAKKWNKIRVKILSNLPNIREVAEFFGENMNGNMNKFTWLKMRFFLNWFPHFLFYLWFFVQFFGSFSSFFKFILLLILCSTLQLLFLSLEQSNIKWEAFSFSPLSAWISAIHSFAHYFISFYW